MEILKIVKLSSIKVAPTIFPDKGWWQNEKKSTMTMEEIQHFLQPNMTPEAGGWVLHFTFGDTKQKMERLKCGAY